MLQIALEIECKQFLERSAITRERRAHAFEQRRKLRIILQRESSLMRAHLQGEHAMIEHRALLARLERVLLEMIGRIVAQ